MTVPVFSSDARPVENAETPSSAPQLSTDQLSANKSPADLPSERIARSIVYSIARSSEETADTVADILDVRGLSCPFPVLRAHRAFRALPEGCELMILASDRTSLRDIPAWCREVGHTVIDIQDEGETVRFRLRRGTRKEARPLRTTDETQKKRPVPP